MSIGCSSRRSPRCSSILLFALTSVLLLSEPGLASHSGPQDQWRPWKQSELKNDLDDPSAADLVASNKKNQRAINKVPDIIVASEASLPPAPTAATRGDSPGPPSMAPSPTALFDEFPTEDVPTEVISSESDQFAAVSSSSSSSSVSEFESESAFSGSSESDTASSSSDDEEEEEEEEEQYDTDSEENSSPLFSSGKRATKRQLKALKEKRQRFLDHIAMISTSFLKKEATAKVMIEEDEELAGIEHDDSEITPQTDLTLPGRHFHIVTTAALPWMTGTAVNPLLRAAYLHRRTQRINNPQNVDVDMVVLMKKRRHSDDQNNDTTTTTTSTHAISSDDQNNHNATNSEQQLQQQQWVTLVIPWLELEEDQMELYGKVFASPNDQEEYIRDWLANNAGMPDAADSNTGLKLLFYPARYHSGLRSIFAMGDICRLIPDAQSDVCILEEPEHCNWFRAPGDGWTQKFRYVVGIVHTNYKEYASAHYSGLWTAPAISLVSSAMVRAYCHQVIKLSDVLQTFAPEKEATSNVHGVRSDFLDIGVRRAKELQATKQNPQLSRDEEFEHMPAVDYTNTTTVYFIGKLLWAKGLDLMMELEDYYKQCTGQYFAIDIYGSGPEQKAIRRAYWGRKLHSKNNSTHLHHHHHHYSHDKRRHHEHHDTKPRTEIFTSRTAFLEHVKKFRESLPTADHWRNFKESIQSAEMPTNLAEFRKQPIPATFPGRVDHASLGEHANYNVFVNPSVSEVLCTTTAEALAMGKFAIIPVHPSNTFFLKFPNCLAYRNKFEFAANLQWALTHDPEPLTPDLAHEFTWEAATDRFIQASAVTWKEARQREKLGLSKRDERIAWFHNELGKGTKGDLLRLVLGGGPASKQVKYVLEQENKTLDDEGEETAKMEKEGVDGDEEESDDEGLTSKFRRSAFVQALHATLANGLPSWERDDD